MLLSSEMIIYYKRLFCESEILNGGCAGLVRHSFSYINNLCLVRLIEGLFIINVSDIVGGYALRAPLRQLDIRNFYNNPVCFVALAC
jgi:hypothetical protein